MAERYSKLYNLPQNLYAEGAPVLISAGTLLKDNQGGKVLCQLKFRNISSRTIKALKVLVTGYDMSGEELCRAQHQYLDMKVEHEGNFGHKEAIPLPDSAARSYTVQVMSVHFADGERWSGREEQDWQPLPEQELLCERLFDRELLRQYKLDTSAKSEYVAQTHRDIWLCACGSVNAMDEACHKCGQNLDELEYFLNTELLLERRNARLLAESEAAAKKSHSRKSTLKVVKIVLLVLIPILLAAGAFFFYQSYQQKLLSEYQMADVLFSSGQYSEAAAAYEALGDYSDAAAKAETARLILSDINNYEKAQKFLENGRYDDAYEAFKAMGNYEDAAELKLEALYQKAMSLVEKNELEDAQELFVELGEYKDAAKQAESFAMLLIEEQASWNDECEGPLKTTYIYDAAGRVIEKTLHFSEYEGLNDRVLSYAWNGDGSYTETEGDTLREYDAWGILLKENGEAKYTYDYGYYDNGMLNYYGAYTVDGNNFEFEQVYDEHGNPIRYSTVDGTAETVNEYDDEGRLTKQENFDMEHKFIDRTSFEYDFEGKLKRSTYMDINSTTILTDYLYELKYIPEAAK